MTFVLGLDGGATKTTAVVLEVETGRREEASYGSSNYLSVGVKTAKKNINDAVLNLVGKVKNNFGIDNLYFESSCFSLSGYDNYEDIKAYKKIIVNPYIKNFLNPNKTIICNDTKIILYVFPENEDKVVLICGTGSKCYGINSKGEEAISNGWDFILGDEGSGYSIGVKALKSIMRFYDGREEPTILLEMVLKDLNLDNIFNLVKWAYFPFSKERIAYIAKIVEKAALAGDKRSTDIIAEEASEAAKSVEAVARKIKD